MPTEPMPTLEEIIGLLEMAEKDFHKWADIYPSKCFALIQDARRKLEAYSQQGKVGKGGNNG